MNAATLEGRLSERPALRRGRSPFAALLGKDLRLAGPVLLVAAGLLVAVSALLAAMPLLGDSALDSAGLTLWKHDALARIGVYSSAFWVMALFAAIASAIVIAAGDAGGRSRYLVPTLPASLRLAYLSKCCAALITLTGFLVVGAIVQSISPTTTGLHAASCVTLVAVALVWAFAAPMFTRTSGGAFVAATVVPALLFIGCATGASVFAPPAIKRILIARGGADWLDELRGVRSSSGSWIDNEITLSIAAAVVLLIGLALAWRARNVVLCRQTPRELRIPRLVGSACLAACAVAVSFIANLAWIWNTEPSIAQIVDKSRRYSEWSALSTSELVARAVGATDIPLEVQDVPKERRLDWERFLIDTRRERLGREQLAGLGELLNKRCINDNEAVRAAAWAILESRPQLSVPARLLAARYLQPRAELAVALRGLSRASRDLERLQLIDAVIRNSYVERLYAGPRGEEAWMQWEGRYASAWNIPPFEVKQGIPREPRDAARRRVRAVIALVAIEQALRTGALSEADPRNPGETFVIDAETVRRAREAIEPTMTELAHALGFTDQDDSGFLLVPTSDLFDGPHTDPAYILPRRD